MDQWLSDREKLFKLWNVFHEWWNTYNNKKSVQHLILKYHRLIKPNPYETREAFYKELRKQKTKALISYKKYRNELRFNTFSNIFYNEMHVDVEFSRDRIYSFLGNYNHQPPIVNTLKSQVSS